MGENMEKEQWMKESLQMQKASWIQDEITKRREREDELLQQIFMEQKMLQELDEDMDENMAHAREGRKYREDMKERVNDRVYEIHDLSADKREGMREYKYAYRRGYALAMFFLFTGIVRLCRLFTWNHITNLSDADVLYRRAGCHFCTSEAVLLSLETHLRYFLSSSFPGDAGSLYRL